MSYKETAPRPTLADLKAHAKQHKFMCDRDQQDAYDLARKNKNEVERLISFMINEVHMSPDHFVPDLAAEYKKLQAPKVQKVSKKDQQSYVNKPISV